MKQFISFGLAVGFSFLLFALMQMLIENDAKAYDSKPTPPISFGSDIKDPPPADPF